MLLMVVLEALVMVIVGIVPVRSISVETDEGDYTRYASDVWYQTMGESEEPLYCCEDLEGLYQVFINNEKKE